LFVVFSIQLLIHIEILGLGHTSVVECVHSLCEDLVERRPRLSIRETLIFLNYFYT
jgi:hypothetical protein